MKDYYNSEAMKTSSGNMEYARTSKDANGLVKSVSSLYQVCVKSVSRLCQRPTKAVSTPYQGRINSLSTPYCGRINSLLSYNFFRHVAAVMALLVMMLAPHAVNAQVATIPYSCDFENGTENGRWALNNPNSYTNHWVIGTSTYSSYNKSLYVSRNGTANEYSKNSASYVYAYRQINFATAGEYSITFKWKARGETGCWDAMYAALVPPGTECPPSTNITGNANYLPTNYINIADVSQSYNTTGAFLWTNANSDWKTSTKTVNITTTGNYYLVFYWKNDDGGGDNPPAAVDDISITISSIITCPKPTLLTNTAITTNSATVDWTENGTASSWILEYSTSNTFPAGSTTSVNVTSKPYTITGLTTETTYYVRVKSNCGGSDLSDWSNTCEVLPSACKRAGSGTDKSYYLPSFSYYNYSLSEQIYTPAEVGSAGALTAIQFYNGGTEKTRTFDIYIVHTTKTAFTSTDDWIHPTAADLVYSGSVTMTAGQWTEITLSSPFNYDGTSNLAIIVDDNTGDYTSSPHMACYTYTTTQCQALHKYDDNEDFNPNSVTTNGTQVYFKNQIKFCIESSSCPDPTGVTVTNITDNSAQVSWTGDAAADSYNVRYRKVILSEDFEEGLPGTWTSVDADGDGYNWYSHINTGSGNYTAHSGDGVVASESYNNDALLVLNPDNWLITPQVALEGTLSFWYIAQSESYPENFQVYVSTTGTAVGDFSAISAEIEADGTYRQFTYNLSSYSGQQGYIAIRHFNVSDQFILNIDDFGIYTDWSTLTTTATSANLTNLDALTTYEVQVQADCGGDGESNWSTEETFVTLLPTPSITQTDDPLPECDNGNATLVASVTSLPAGYTFHWYSNSTCTTEITTDVSGPNNNTLRYPATDGGHVWCRLEKHETSVTIFSYTGSVQTYTVPSGTTSLALEVWGAQGGNADTRYTGGLGGYSVGTLSSPSGTLYVCVGGQGTTDDGSYYSSTTLAGGYNGGGAGRAWSGTYHSGAGGGGASHIATATGVLRNLSGNTTAVLIVAGGGGGASDNGNGGAGGGTSGVAGSGTNGCNPGTQTTGSAWGYATDCTYTDGECGGGGGGWYGGYSATGENYAGGGGSGYLKSTLTEASTTAGQREGNGQAKITATVNAAGPAGTVTIQCCDINITIGDIATQTICAGGSTTLNPSITGGNAPFTYDWYKGSTLVSTSTTTSSYSTPTSDATLGATNHYTIKVTDACGTEKEKEFTVNVYSDITIGDIAAQTICAGGSATLAPTISGGKTPYASYAWYKDGGSTPVATTATYTTPAGDATFGASHTYTIKVTDGCGTVKQKTFTVNVYSDITVSDDNQERSICKNTITLLEPTISGGKTPYASYAWYKDGSATAIPSATSDEYTVPAADAVAGQTHTYKIKVTDDCGTVKEFTYTIHIWADLTGTLTSPITGICQGTTTALTVSGLNNIGTPSYQWERSPNGTSDWSTIGGATGATYNAPINEAGHVYYRVNITDGGRASGCNTLTLSTDVVVNDTLEPGLPATLEICVSPAVNNSVTLTSAGTTTDYNYVWSIPSGGTITSGSVSSNPVTIRFSPAGVYTVTMTAENKTTHCISHGKTVVTAKATPTPTITALDDGVCYGDEITLTAEVSGGTTPYTYTWATITAGNDDPTPNDPPSTATVTPATTGTVEYTLTVRGGNGCEATSPTFAVTVKRLEATMTITAP